MSVSNKQIDIKSLKGITQDSRAVRPGYLFAALQGSKLDGHDYIEGAILNGACAILAPEGTVLPSLESFADVVLVTDKTPRKALALMAAEFYDRQSRDIVAITGTNGKTSTVHFAQQLWKSQGISAASLGTLSGSMTTPDPVSLHAELADLAAAGITHLALEASSHGLDQHRLDGVKIKVAGFTNLSHDHLDYHGDMDRYRAAKFRLFADVLDDGGTAVLNADSQEYSALRNVVIGRGCNVLSYGMAGDDLKILSIVPTPGGQKLELNILGQDYELTLPLVGAFQIMNALCALGMVLAGDASKQDKYVQALENLQGAPGRLQLISGHPKGAAIYVDYAHTPDALENVLNALRPHISGRLVCVFGCGGDRDADKREVMGKIVNKLADDVIVTDDNPRNEAPEEIRSAILACAKGAIEIADRREAIQSAIGNLQEGDVLLIAGKGHEQGQVFADRTDPFNDIEEANKAIEELGA